MSSPWSSAFCMLAVHIALLKAAGSFCVFLQGFLRGAARLFVMPMHLSHFACCCCGYCLSLLAPRRAVTRADADTAAIATSTHCLYPLSNAVFFLCYRMLAGRSTTKADVGLLLERLMGQLVAQGGSSGSSDGSSGGGSKSYKPQAGCDVTLQELLGAFEVRGLLQHCCWWL